MPIIDPAPPRSPFLVLPDCVVRASEIVSVQECLQEVTPWKTHITVKGDGLYTRSTVDEVKAAMKEMGLLR